MLLRAVIAVLLLSTPARAEEFLTLGPQWVARRWGGEASLLKVEFSGHVTGGAGIVLGADQRGPYAEGEAILILTPHNELAAKLGHEYPMFFFTLGAGPVVRWADGGRGWQATLSGALMFLPLMFVARAERFAGTAAVLNGGLMLKLPIRAFF
jgi:hypothetical protein